MTRKDYEAIASMLKTATDFAVYKDDRAARAQHALTVMTMAHQLELGNPRFNRIKFMLACGLSKESIEAL